MEAQKEVFHSRNSSFIEKTMKSFGSPHELEASVERLHRGASIDSCDSGGSGGVVHREHNKKEEPFSKTLFKIKPIACTSRLLKGKKIESSINTLPKMETYNTMTKNF